MSRIGKMPVNLPKGVTANVASNNMVTVKGPKGELKLKVDPDMKVAINDGVITVDRPSENKRHKAMHGLYRALLSNMVIGTTDGYKTVMEMVGVGYRATVTGQLLELSVGFTHPVLFAFPKEVKVTAAQEKGSEPNDYPGECRQAIAGSALC